MKRMPKYRRMTMAVASGAMPTDCYRALNMVTPRRWLGSSAYPGDADRNTLVNHLIGMSLGRRIWRSGQTYHALNVMVFFPCPLRIFLNGTSTNIVWHGLYIPVAKYDGQITVLKFGTS